MSKSYPIGTGASTLPPFLKTMLANPPRAGEGVHNWLFQVSRQLHAHRPAGEIVSMLSDCVQNCGRSVPLKEIQDAVRNALDCAWQPRGGVPQGRSRSKWPAVNHEQQEAIVRDQGGLTKKGKLSSHTLDNTGPRRFLVCEFDKPVSAPAAGSKTTNALAAADRRRG